MKPTFKVTHTDLECSGQHVTSSVYQWFQISSCRRRLHCKTEIAPNRKYINMGAFRKLSLMLLQNTLRVYCYLLILKRFLITFISVCGHVCVHKCRYVGMHMCIYAHAWVCACICMCACVCAYAAVQVGMSERTWVSFLLPPYGLSGRVASAFTHSDPLLAFLEDQFLAWYDSPWAKALVMQSW